MRIQVRETMRNELESLIKAEGANVTFTLSDAGDLVLEGLILDDSKAERFLRLVRENLAGTHSLESRIRTASSLLDAVQKLAKTSGINETTSFRIDGALVEASGAIPPDKVDAWVGFLQAYSRRFASDIPLRSLVQLVDERGQLVVDANSGTPNAAIVVGSRSKPAKGAVLDVDKLRQGAYDLADVLVGAPRKLTPPAGKPAPLMTAPSTQPVPLPATPPAAQATAPTPQPQSRTGQSLSFDDVANLASSHARDQSLSGTAEGLIMGWGAGSFAIRPENKKLNAAVGELAEKWTKAANLNRTQLGGKSDAIRQRLLMETKLVPLLNGEASGPSSPDQACWPGSTIDTERLPTALFWLDLLSNSDLFSLATFKKSDQGLILEAALNPQQTETCARRIEVSSGVTFAALSLYLQEARRNADFIRFILRDFNPFPLEISGAQVMGDRFVQTRSGQKLREGATPTGASRLSHIGELGVAVQTEAGFATITYGPRLAWLTSPMPLSVK